MKQRSKKITGIITVIVCALSSFAQNWQVGGNTNPQLGGNPPIIGTIGNNRIQFHTANLRRMTLFDNTFSNALFGPNNSTPNGGGLAIHLNPANKFELLK